MRTSKTKDPADPADPVPGEGPHDASESDINSCEMGEFREPVISFFCSCIAFGSSIWM